MYVTRAAYDAPDKAMALATDVLTEVRARYTTTPANATVAQAVTAIQADAEYQRAGGGANQIGAAYAYARGHTGEGVIISNMGGRVSLNNNDLDTGQVLHGYTASDGGTGLLNGRCTVLGLRANDCLTGQASHLAGIMVGVSGNVAVGFMQGIAYDASLKPIDIVAGNVFKNDNTKLTTAIIEATKVNASACSASADKGIEACNVITVMNNGWDISAMGTYDDGGTDRYYNTPSALSTILAGERPVWGLAVQTTVVVFAAGDYGYNSENGEVRLYMDEDRTTKLFKAGSTTEQKTVAWKDIEGGGGNQASSHARLASSHANAHNTVKGKWLAVIALGENDRIWKHSNGCGDAKAYCLGAPGVNITSAAPTEAVILDKNTAVLSGTAQAAAHVTGAVAVLKSAFNHLTPAELVEVILATADDIGIAGVDDIYGHGALNLAKALEPIGSRTICLPDNNGVTPNPSCEASGSGITVDNSGITLPTSFGESLNGFTVGFIDDYKRAYIGNPARITRTNAAFTLGDTIATWDSPELQSIVLDSNSKMQFTNGDDNEDGKDTLMFTHHLPNHTIGFAYNEESKTPDLSLTDTGDELHFQKIRPIASDLMQLNSAHKLSKAWNVKNAITSGEFDTGNRFNEAMTNLHYTGEHNNLTIGAGTLQEYGQFLGASGTGAYQLSDATSSQVTHLAITQNLPRNSIIKVKYTNFKTEVDMRYNNFANINDLTADEYQLSLTKKQIWGKNDSLNLELIQPFAVTDGTLQQNTVLGYNDQGDYNNVTQNYTLKPETRRQQIRMTWQNQINNLKTKTNLFISMQYENNVNNLRDNNDSQILGGISTKF